jgi:hypothetical protein
VLHRGVQVGPAVREDETQQELALSSYVGGVAGAVANEDVDAVMEGNRRPARGGGARARRG